MKLFSARLAQVSICLSTLLVMGTAHASTSLIDWSQSVLSDIKSPTWSDANCVPYLTDLEQKVDQVGTDPTSKDDLKSQASTVIETLWQVRIALHDHLAGASDACAAEIRNTFRKVRFLEDFLGEMAADMKPVSPDSISFQDQTIPLLEDSPNYLTQKRDGMPVLQEGDLIIARGTSFLSSMIATMGQSQSQFSHVIMVAKDPATGNLETIESYVNDGVHPHEIHWAMKNENSRLLVLRAKDQDLAKKAAQVMLQKVTALGAAHSIPYDYKLDSTDHSSMSCAEVAQSAYQWASNNQFILPERPSRLDRGINLLNYLQVTPGPTFTPGDLEGDSRFDLVAEFRDLRLTRDSRLKDALMSKMFEWMDTEAGQLHNDLSTTLAEGPIYDVRHTPFWPVVRKILHVADFSAAIPRAMVGAVNLVGDFGAGVQKALQANDDAYLAQNGLYMTYNELYDKLETIKSEDQARFDNKKTRKNSIIFKYLRAK